MKNIMLVLIILFACSISNNGQTNVTGLPESKHTFIVIAHRGDHTQVPENTIAAFNEGIKNGVDYVEMDLRTTKDSVLVIMHDASVDRITNGKGKVSDLTYAEIKQLIVMDRKKDSIK